MRIFRLLLLTKSLSYQEHVRKSIPKLTEKNDEMISENSKIQGAIFDLDYSLEAIVKMVRADTSFDVTL